MEVEMTSNDRTEPTPQNLLKVSKVAKVCDCSEKQVRRWIDSRELVAHRLGRLIRIAPKDLETFLKMRRD